MDEAWSVVQPVSLLIPSEVAPQKDPTNSMYGEDGVVAVALLIERRTYKGIARRQSRGLEEEYQEE